LELSRLDSLEEEKEDFVAHLTVPSERRGEVCSGGAMARWRRYCGVFLLRLVTRKGEKGWGKKGSGGAREGEGLGFCRALEEAKEGEKMGSRWKPMVVDSDVVTLLA
jgi:hypothetical protein